MTLRYAQPGRAQRRAFASSLMLLGALLVCVFTLAGCAIPADPEGTLDRVRGGVLRVGVTENAPWVTLRDSTEPLGLEPDIVRSFASEQDAQIEWTAGSEQELVEDLERGELDVLIGGFTDDTPWSKRAATTRPYVESRDSDGAIEKHIMLARLGENALLLQLDRFLLSEVNLDERGKPEEGER